MTGAGDGGMTGAGDGSPEEPQNGDEKVTKDEKVDCRVFEDQLDTLVKDELPGEGKAQLRRHAESCPDCAMQMRMQEHLAAPSLEELEKEVPDEMLATMWNGVNAALADRRRTRRSWLVPTLAAASVALLFVTGFLARELSQVKERESALAQQVREQQGWLAELDAGLGNDPVVRTAALVGGGSPVTRALARRETLTLEELRSMLRSLPANRILLEAGDARAILGNPSGPAPPLWREVLGDLDVRNGVKAGDLLLVLETMDVNPSTTVSTSELIELLS